MPIVSSVAKHDLYNHPHYCAVRIVLRIFFFLMNDLSKRLWNRWLNKSENTVEFFSSNTINEK